jgi:hypothetical protein
MNGSSGVCLVGISRASLYYEPVEESQENLVLLRLIDRHVQDS